MKREREREKLETENKEEERCNKLDRRERSCFSITTKKHIHLNEKNISILLFSFVKRQLVSITLTTNNINNKNTFNKNVHRSSTKAHHDLLLFVRNNLKRCEKSAETVGKRNNDPIYD